MKEAGREVDFKFIKVISRKYSQYLTVVIELNNADYELLNNSNFWDSQTRIRKFLGWRWWRGPREPRVKPQDIKNSERATWGCGAAAPV